MFSQMVTLRRSALVVLALLASASSAFAQFEIVVVGGAQHRRHLA